MALFRRSSRSKAADPSEEGASEQGSTRVASSSGVRRRQGRETASGLEAPSEEEEGYEGEEGYPEEDYPEEDYGEQEPPEEELPPEEDEDDNPDATRAGPPLTLEIIEGPDRGKRRRFKSVRMVIGRGQGCDVLLSDQSVSRRHVELVYGDGGVLLRDLGSGNGTKVNDERVDEQQLAHEDVIAIGRTKLRFIDEQERIRQMRAAAEEAERKEKEAAEAAAAAAAAKAEQGEGGEEAGAEGGEPAPDGEENKATQVRSIDDIPRRNKRPDRRKGLLLAGGVLLLLALIGGGISFLTRGPPPPPPVDPKVEQSRALLQEARNAFRRGDFAEAVRLAQEAEELQPGVDSEGFLEVARKELSIVQAFQQVRQLMEKHAFDKARELLAKTPRGTTLFTDEERERLEKELETRATGWLVQQVEALLEARDVEGARALIRRLPMERQPLYLSRLAELEALLAQEAADAAARERNARLAAARRAKLARAEFIVEAFRVVEARFNAGDYSRAALECDRVIDAHRSDREIRERARRLKKLIPRFARVYLDAQRKLQLNALASAARPLSSSAELYRQIGFNGSVGEMINDQLAVTSLVAGQAALGREDIAGAAGHFQEALRLRPGDSQASAAMEKIQDKLDELYMQAYVQRDREPSSAAVKFRLVADLATEGSELKAKAQEQLEALQ